MKRRIWALAVVAVAGLALAACSVGTSQDAAGPAAPESAEPTASPAPPTKAPEEQISPTAMPEPTATPDSTDSDEIPTGSSALKASPPNQVSLTGDKPRLVEFFAFW